MAVVIPEQSEQVITSTQAPVTTLRNADIVMKGGITSGVVYPGAVWELSQAFRFRSVGGTSAGAIAAAATAAAEHGRQSGQGEGFDGVRTLPGWLAADGGRLIGLFRPEAETSALFNVATACIGDRRGRLRRVTKAAGQSYPVQLLIGSIPALSLAVASIAGGWVTLPALVATVAIAALVVIVAVLHRKISVGKTSPARESRIRDVRFLAIALLIIVAALGIMSLADRHGVAGQAAAGVMILLVVIGLALVTPTVLVAGMIAAHAITRVPNNMFGLCSGNGPESEQQRPALTIWLSQYLDRLAGVPQDESVRRPLTFGDLARHDITLQMMTSNLSAARAYRLPFDQDCLERWYFDPDEFRKLFPAYVVDWMLSPDRHPDDTDARIDGKVRLPDMADFPVVVATRMSLSFPILLSAVPLYARKPGARPGPAGGPAFERAWFSDGGLVSNFPIHFFDGPIPRWPTFAINLRGFPKGKQPSANPRENVSLSDLRSNASPEEWSEITGLAGFAASLKSTLENSHDNELMRQAGYRERIAHVRLSGDEGGLNLNMPVERVTLLSQRGAVAGKELRRRFTAPAGTENSWANHRWTRYRITMANLQDFLARFVQAFDYRPETQANEPDLLAEPSYEELATRANGVPSEEFFWSTEQEEFAALARETLIDLARSWAETRSHLDDGALRPHPELRNAPRI